MLVIPPILECVKEVDECPSPNEEDPPAIEWRSHQYQAGEGGGQGALGKQSRKGFLQPGKQPEETGLARFCLASGQHVPTLPSEETGGILTCSIVD